MRLDLNPALVRGAQGAFSFPYIPAQFLDGALVLGYVFATLLLKDLHEVLHHTLVIVLASKVGIAIGGNRLENTFSMVSRVTSKVPPPSRSPPGHK